MSALGLRRPTSRASSERYHANASNASAYSALGLQPPRSATRVRRRPAHHDTQSRTDTITHDVLEDIGEDSRQFWCPCRKFRPPPNLEHKARRLLALRHWRNCQGTLPPNRRPGDRYHNQTQRQAIANAANRDRLVKLFNEWHTKIATKHPLFPQAICDYDTTCVSQTPGTQKTSTGTAMVTKYLCRRCGQYRALNYLKARPCSKRTVGTTIVQYMRMTHSAKFAAKDKKQRNAGNNSEKAKAAARARWQKNNKKAKATTTNVPTQHNTGS